MSSYLREYGVATTIAFPLIKRAVQDFAVGADYTHASGDVKISKDYGAAATATNAPSALTMGNGAVWTLALTATEMQAKTIVVTIIDAATKAIEDQAIVIETYGDGQGELDLRDFADVLLGRSVATIEASAAEHSLATLILEGLEWSVSGSTLTIKRTDGTTTHFTKTLTTTAGVDPITAMT
jgi:hypothetical protein